ncbi:MAG: proline--tRNA ligase [Planctomycetota bacterium]
MARNITPRAEDYSKWYGDIITAADMAEHSDVRGCMIIKPTGYAIWELMQADLDRRFKETGHVNAYFPMFIPKSYLAKEASHVEGFAMECAIVTHYGLKAVRNGDKVDVIVDPDKVLEEPLIVRPTSETIINAAYAKWVQSYRDLPILINQWANVCRWEMRTRLFLRTAEFLWQEGHTAHATHEEAEEEALKMLGVYSDFMHECMAVPVIRGKKSDSERFAGALHTYCVEAMMQNGWALQAGTSHHLGQNFARAFGTQFQNKDGQLEHVHQTSWGVSTRMIGALIMAHADDDGMVIPPRLAFNKVVIVPIWKKDDEKAAVLEFCDKLHAELKHLGCKIDDRDIKPAQKFFHWEQRGVPMRLEVGPKDLAKNSVFATRRFDKEKKSISADGIRAAIEAELDGIQAAMLAKATTAREANTYVCDSYDEFKERVEGGGFYLCHWDGTRETEAKVKEDTKATIRCIPFDAKEEAGKCMVSGKPSSRRVIYARAF